MPSQFLSDYRPWQGLFGLDFTCAVASELLELAFPVAITDFIAKFLPAGNLRLTLAAAAGLLTIYAVNAVLMSVIIYWGHRLGINTEAEILGQTADRPAGGKSSRKCSPPAAKRPASFPRSVTRRKCTPRGSIEATSKI